jgi:hypothetical protein
MPRPTEYPCDFDPVEHVYRDVHGRAHDSITQILSDCECSDFSMVDPFVLAQAADRGTRCHHYSAQWDRLRGHLTIHDYLRDFAVDLDLHGHLLQYERFLSETGFVAIPEETERPRLVSIHGTIVGMTPDRIGHFPRNRRLVVIDIKTGVYQLSHPLQIAGYSMGVERSLKLAMMHERIALYLTETNYRLAYHPHQQDFYAMLDAIRGGGEYLDQWKQNQQRKLHA